MASSVERFCVCECDWQLLQVYVFSSIQRFGCVFFVLLSSTAMVMPKCERDGYNNNNMSTFGRDDKTTQTFNKWVVYCGIFSIFYRIKVLMKWNFYQKYDLEKHLCDFEVDFFDAAAKPPISYLAQKKRCTRSFLVLPLVRFHCCVRKPITPEVCFSTLAFMRPVLPMC